MDSNPILTDSRRAFLNSCGIGFGGMALASMLHDEVTAARREPHFAPKAKRAINICLVGGL
ncbi:MAG: DUF1501 domain-containing protein, partial [Pirellulales bacterium]